MASPHKVTCRFVVGLGALATGVLLVLSPVAWADRPKTIVYPGLDAAAVRADSGAIGHIPPDPPPMKARNQWVFDLRWSRGEPYLLAVDPLDLGAPAETPRAMGRFAIELFEGPTLIERVRFDFPMLGVPEPLEAGFGAPPSLERKLTSRIGVTFPAVNRGTRLELWSRATDRRWPLPWPPEERAGSADGGAGAP